MIDPSYGRTPYWIPGNTYRASFIMGPIMGLSNGPTTCSRPRNAARYRRGTPSDPWEDHVMDHVTDTGTAPHQTLDQWSNQWSDTLLDQVSNMFLVPPQSKHDQHAFNKDHWSNT